MTIYGANATMASSPDDLRAEIHQSDWSKVSDGRAALRCVATPWPDLHLFLFLFSSPSFFSFFFFSHPFSSSSLWVCMLPLLLLLLLYKHRCGGRGLRQTSIRLLNAKAKAKAKPRFSFSFWPMNRMWTTYERWIVIFRYLYYHKRRSNHWQTISNQKMT